MNDREMIGRMFAKRLFLMEPILKGLRWLQIAECDGLIFINEVNIRFPLTFEFLNLSNKFIDFLLLFSDKTFELLDDLLFGQCLERFFIGWVCFHLGDWVVFTR